MDTADGLRNRSVDDDEGEHDDAEGLKKKLSLTQLLDRMLLAVVEKGGTSSSALVGVVRSTGGGRGEGLLVGEAKTPPSLFVALVADIASAADVVLSQHTTHLSFLDLEELCLPRGLLSLCSGLREAEAAAEACVHDDDGAVSLPWKKKVGASEEEKEDERGTAAGAAFVLKGGKGRSARNMDKATSSSSPPLQ